MQALYMKCVMTIFEQNTGIKDEFKSETAKDSQSRNKENSTYFSKSITLHCKIDEPKKWENGFYKVFSDFSEKYILGTEKA